MANDRLWFMCVGCRSTSPMLAKYYPSGTGWWANIGMLEDWLTEHLSAHASENGFNLVPGAGLRVLNEFEFCEIEETKRAALRNPPLAPAAPTTEVP